MPSWLNTPKAFKSAVQRFTIAGGCTGFGQLDINDNTAPARAIRNSFMGVTKHFGCLVKSLADLSLVHFDRSSAAATFDPAGSPMLPCIMNATLHLDQSPALLQQLPTKPWPWVRDFALVGATTGFFAPFSVLRNAQYAALASLGGTLFGIALGLCSARMFAGRARRWARWVYLPLGGLLGALWGAAAGLATAPLWPKAVGLSVVVAGIAGALQFGWFWLAYALRRVNRRSTWAVTLLALLIGGGLGWAAVFAFFAIGGK